MTYENENFTCTVSSKMSSFVNDGLLFDGETGHVHETVQLMLLKGNATLKGIVLESKEPYKQWILTQIWSKSVEN